MTNSEQLWLVEREYTDKGVVNLVYATEDGTQYFRKQLSQQLLARTEVTAGRTVETGKLAETHEDDRERFASEARRMAEKHDPDDAV